MTTASSPVPVPAPAWGRVRRFVAWWSDELSDIAASRASVARPWKVMLLRRERGCDLYLRTRDSIEHIGTSSSPGDRPFEELRRRLGRQQIAPADIVLRLQPSEVVQARINVPAAARDVLEAILRNQIERLAPWPVDKALFAHEIGPATDGPTNLEVTLAIAGRSLVERLVAELSEAGLGPGVVDFGTDASAESRINLLTAHGQKNRRAGRLLLSAAGLTCLAALVAGAIGTAMLAQQTGELDVLNVRLAELRRKAAAELPSQASLRRQSWLVAQRGSQSSMAIVLEALSRALPDEAWLNRLEVEQGVARLTGDAANAAPLIGQIEASGHFTEVRFSAPTTLAEGGDRETFTISGKIVPRRTLN